MDDFVIKVFRKRPYHCSAITTSLSHIKHDPINLSDMRTTLTKCHLRTTLELSEGGRPYHWRYEKDTTILSIRGWNFDSHYEDDHLTMDDQFTICIILFIHQSVVYLYICLSLYLSINISVYLFNYLHIYLYRYFKIYLSLYSRVINLFFFIHSWVGQLPICLCIYLYYICTMSVP